MNDKVFTFNVEVYGDMLSYASLPIYDDAYNLIGAFIVDKGQQIAGFVSGTKSPAALAISTGDSFFFTTHDGEDGKIDFAILTEYRLYTTSILVDKAL